jgi:hypothetical protein
MACAVWAGLMDNPWMTVPTMAAGPVLKAELTIPGPNEPGPFSLADVEHVTALLDRAGFEDITVDRIESSRVITSATADEDVRTLLEVGPVGAAYEAADDSTRQQAVDAVVAAIEPFRDADGWRLPGAGLTIAARRP